MKSSRISHPTGTAERDGSSFEVQGQGPLEKSSALLEPARLTSVAFPERKAKLMQNSGSGNGRRINLFDQEWFPEIADLVGILNETQRATIEQLVVKDPKETWAPVAKRLGISERQLRNIRGEERVQEACYRIAKKLFRSEIPDVLNVLTRKAKMGQAWAVKLFLEVSAEMVDANRALVIQSQSDQEELRKAQDALAELQKMSPRSCRRTCSGD